MDLLRLQWRSVGVQDTVIRDATLTAVLRDAAGYCSERFRWPALYADQSAQIVFVVALDSFQFTMEEDPDKNQMRDSLDSFQELLADPAVPADRRIILVFTKLDVFPSVFEKNKDRFSQAFPSFEAKRTLSESELEREALDYIKSAFLSSASGHRPEIVMQTSFDASKESPFCSLLIAPTTDDTEHVSIDNIDIDHASASGNHRSSSVAGQTVVNSPGHTHSVSDDRMN
jgi:G-protein alpha subunit